MVEILSTWTLNDPQSHHQTLVNSLILYIPGNPAECDTISLTPIPEETKKDVDTVDKIEPLSTETSNLLESKECKTIKLTPIPEETNKNVKTIDVEPLRKETSALLQQFVSNDLVDVVLGMGSQIVLQTLR